MLTAKKVERLLLDVITTPTERDKQIKLGASDLGDTCERCLGLTLAGRLPDGPRYKKDDRFNLKGWVGTAVHEKLERDVGATAWAKKSARLEQKLVFGKIPGYGQVKGKCDIFVIKKKIVVVCDYKTANVADIRKMRAAQMVSPKYRVQLHAYGRGVARLGYNVTEVMNLFIPRDSITKSEIWTFSEPYDPKIVKRALVRAHRIWKLVENGQLEYLQSAKGCYSCNSWTRDLEFI